ncbi:MAG: MBL fold metallo-hydrolase, partial [Bdellovibrionota bacterium]
ERTSNVHVKPQTTRDEFVKFRMERDKTLSAPKLLLPSVQMNLNAGRLPAPRKNGRRYLNIPIE